MRTIAFVGNCQMRGLAAIYQNFAGKRQGDTAHYIRTETAAQPASLQRLIEADLVIGQLMEMGSTLGAVQSTVRDKKIVHVPHAAGAFLWPQAGEPHATARGLLAPRFAPSQRAWVLTGKLVPVSPAVPASAGEDADDR